MNIDNHISPALGKMKIQLIKAPQITKYLKDKLSNCGLSNLTIKNIILY
ncbi:MAG: hypothetical protein HFJ84_09955 [Clostridiales bacterium]|nr:hypothetical protein [Clostridiales bacterium]